MAACVSYFELLQIESFVSTTTVQSIGGQVNAKR